MSLDRGRYTAERLRSAGFRYFDVRKRLTMARLLPESEAPKYIPTDYEMLVATAGYYICYQPTADRKTHLDDYHHWPVAPQHFNQTYCPWDEPNWKPSSAEVHMMQQGCKPYYKHAGVWARRATKPLKVQSLESQEPLEVPVGAWICVGINGEPYVVSDEDLKQRYIVMD